MIEKQEIAPDKIFALTFSREAARNMEKIVYVSEVNFSFQIIDFEFTANSGNCHFIKTRNRN